MREVWCHKRYLTNDPTITELPDVEGELGTELKEKDNFIVSIYITVDEQPKLNRCRTKNYSKLKMVRGGGGKIWREDHLLFLALDFRFFLFQHEGEFVYVVVDIAYLGSDIGGHSNCGLVRVTTCAK